jgi:hypothetical protein
LSQALDDPVFGQHHKSFGLIGAFGDFDLKVRQDFGGSLLKDRALSAVSKEFCKNGYKPNKVDRTTTPPSRS